VTDGTEGFQDGFDFFGRLTSDFPQLHATGNNVVVGQPMREFLAADILQTPCDRLMQFLGEPEPFTQVRSPG
jgi:hypothetical protein